MAVQAVWNLANLAEDEGDPVQDIMALAKPIDLSKDVATLNDELTGLLKFEARIHDEHGVECERKWSPQHDGCHLCPYYRGDEQQGWEGALCRLGRKQDDKLAEIEERKALDETAKHVEAVMLADALDELAEALLPV